MTGHAGASRVSRLAALAVAGPLFCLLLAQPGAAQSFVQSAKCGVFYEKWDVAGAPVATLATVGLAHEQFAARDCVGRGESARACEHYRRALGKLDRVNEPLASDTRRNIESKMAEIGCQ
ncbi:MAG TPA: hypothetical protein VF274_02125 [Alphaproteobacteria bacterium]|jgi:hypothetical protein